MPEDRVFTYREALDTFPRVQKLTETAVRRVEAIYRQLADPEAEARLAERVEIEANEVIEKWAAAVMALGCQVKGLWLVDWDSGDGYYCWRYPEATIGHFHTYEDGFAGRMPIA
jgi:hypothetical protein